MELLNGSPNLETLEAKYIRFDNIDPSFKSKGKLKTLSKLVRADLSFMMMKILRAYDIDEFVRKFGNADIPIFPNLIHLRLILGGIVKVESVLYLLNHCPQLQTFVLVDNSSYKGWPNTPVAPECFSSLLQTCIITRFRGTQCDMKFSKFVMQNSTSLRTMTICCVPNLDPQEKLEMIAEFASCPRSSATCELLFK